MSTTVVLLVLSDWDRADVAIIIVMMRSHAWHGTELEGNFILGNGCGYIMYKFGIDCILWGRQEMRDLYRDGNNGNNEPKSKMHKYFSYVIEFVLREYNGEVL